MEMTIAEERFIKSQAEWIETIEETAEILDGKIIIGYREDKNAESWNPIDPMFASNADERDRWSGIFHTLYGRDSVPVYGGDLAEDDAEEGGE